LGAAKNYLLQENTPTTLTTVFFCDFEPDLHIWPRLARCEPQSQN